MGKIAAFHAAFSLKFSKYEIISNHHYKYYLEENNNLFVTTCSSQFAYRELN